MWRVTSVTHFSNFGRESGYTHEGGKTKVVFIKGTESRHMTIKVDQTRYKKGEHYQLKD